MRLTVTLLGHNRPFLRCVWAVQPKRPKKTGPRPFILARLQAIGADLLDPRIRRSQGISPQIWQVTKGSNRTYYRLAPVRGGGPSLRARAQYSIVPATASRPSHDPAHLAHPAPA
jgi:hypothetical protein